MAKAHGFGAVLARVRKEQGHATAHAFYGSRDGRRSLGLTYRNYLNLEQGRSLPKPERFERLLAALGLEAHSDGARALVEAYFAALGLAGLLRYLPGKPAQAAADEGWKLGALAARRAVELSRISLTLDQWKVRAADFEANTCYVAVSSTKGPVALAALAKMTGLAQPAVRRAVRKLAAAGLLKLEGGAARIPWEGKSVAALPRMPATVGIHSALARHVDRWAEGAKPAHVRTSVVRLPQEGVEQFKRHLDELMRIPFLYMDRDSSPDSAVYLVRGQVLKLFS